ncbi:hypothetical protein INS49_009975 [Diaporthe citri]|uniref:uncharacterized protein n=1 Tax=Diaporthe citri TaxID=83186 RepID=UPI001C7FC91E|nr:uncharacterized protein INS49_009975 [Diaporthe citri]KAG6361747.1 hypothetical protein INS49_009975 [Diaporthe citri]
MRRRAVPRSAQYGQACMLCVKAKCRCVGRSDGKGCERCNRLSKQCRPHETASQRAANNSQDSDDRFAQLEGRLDTLVSLLKARADGNGSHDLVPDDEQSRHIPFTPDSPSSNSHILVGPADANTESDTDVEFGVDHGRDSNGLPQIETTVLSGSVAVQTIPNHHNPLPVSTSVSLEPTDDVHVACLDTFRTLMLLHFPVVYLAQTLTAEQLHRDRPLLFQAIVCVTWPYPEEKEARAVELKRTLCEAAFLRQRRADMNQSCGVDPVLDLLLGLMTYVAWGWDHVHNRGSLSHLVMLCMSLVGEMRLDRPALDGHYADSLLAPVASRGSLSPPQPSAEAQRAVLGCFVLSSVVSEYLGNMDPLAWTPQLDKILNDTTSYRNFVDNPPGLVGITSLAHTHYVELLILEAIRASTLILSRLDAPETTNAATVRSSPMQEPTTPGYSDLSYMWQSVLAISACTSGLLSLQASDFLGIAFLQWGQLAGCVVVLSQLEGLEDSRINRAHARSVIDLPLLLDRIAEKLELTAAHAGEQGLGPPGGVFTQLAAGMRAFRSRIQGSLVELSRPSPNEVSGCGGSNEVQPLQGHLNTQGPSSRFWMDQLFQG